LAQFWLKAFGKEGWGAIRWIKPSLDFFIVTALITLAALASWAYLGPHDSTMQNLLLIMSLFVLGRTVVELVGSTMQLEENYAMLALWQLLPNLLQLAVIAVAIYAFSAHITVIDVAWIYGLVNVAFIGIGIYYLNRVRQGKFTLKGHNKSSQQNTFIRPQIKDVFIEAWPFGMASFFAFIYVQSDIIMVKYMVGDTEAGFYNVAFVILTAIMILPNVLYQKYFLPKYHRWANHDRKKFYEVYKKGNIAMLISGIAIMLALLIVSDWVVFLFFGQEYQKSVALINILALTIPIYFLSYNVSSTLVTNEHMKKKVRYMGIAAITNIALNFILIKHLGAKGAAIATLGSYGILLTMYFYASNKYVFINENKTTLK
jgi:O-antigen/teichoic acid export membrane protein